MASNYGEQVRPQSGLAQARDLARSGMHANWESVEAVMMPLDTYPTVRRWFQDRSFRAQLDKLCVLGRSGLTEPRGPRGGRPRSPPLRTAQ